MTKEPAEKMANETAKADLETESRREAIKKIGRFTTYVAPVMLGVISQKAAAAS